jgi:hypothetical protein
MRQKEMQKLEILDLRIPDWNPFPEEKRGCPFCGGHSKALFLMTDNLPVSQCSNCRTTVLNAIGYGSLRFCRACEVT